MLAVGSIQFASGPVVDLGRNVVAPKDVCQRPTDNVDHRTAQWCRTGIRRYGIEYRGVQLGVRHPDEVVEDDGDGPVRFFDDVERERELSGLRGHSIPSTLE